MTQHHLIWVVTAAAFSFLAAFIFAFIKHLRTKLITSVWGIISLSISLIFLATVARFLEYTTANFTSLAFSKIKVTLILLSAAFFAAALALYRKERKLCMDCLNPKLKAEHRHRYDKIEKWLKGI